MEPPGEHLGPYRLVRPIGSGGMGQVFAAVHERMDQTVALKRLSPAAAEDPQLVARFIQEARALARLQHPGVVRVLGCDRLEDGTVYLAMEFLEGLSLRAWMQGRPGAVALGAALPIARQIADAMIAVHAACIVHRDLKPENVFLCPAEDRAPGHRVKIIDFGIAKVPPRADGAGVDTQVQTSAPVLLGTSILRQVPTITGWIEGERARLERHADLEALAHAWEQAGGPSIGLPSGTLLAHYRAVEAPGRLARMASARALRFLEAAERLERRRSRITRALAAVLFTAAMAIAGSAILAWREQQRAEENLQSVLSATDEIVGDVDWTLGRYMHTLDVRRKMLLDIEERLVRLPEQDRPEVRAAIISTKHRRSDLARNSETLAQADVLLIDAAQRIREALARAQSDGTLLELLGLNLSKRGKVALARGQQEVARAFFADALDLFARSQSTGGAENARRTMATSYAEQADLELTLGRADAAGPLYQRAIVLLEQNDSDYDRGELALTLCGRGEAARKAGDPKAAGGYLHRAFSLQTRLVGAEPGNAYSRWILARIHVELAALRRAEGARDAAAKHLLKARDLAREMHQGEATNKNYALVLYQSLREEEELTLAQGGTSDAARLRAERCALAATFARADSEDVRFKPLVCP
jgi:tetratricopeptide (TPR) repeat protein